MVSSYLFNIMAMLLCVDDESPSLTNVLHTPAISSNLLLVH